MTQGDLRNKLEFRVSPLFELALSLLVILNPERFAPLDPWVERVRERVRPHVLDDLREHATHTDFLALAVDLASDHIRVPQALDLLQEQQPGLGGALLAYWEALAPEVAANAGVVGESLQREAARFRESEPHEFLCDFSDRVSVSEDEEFLDLEWGRGMRIPLSRLERILLVPSTFCPRRIMFYRHGAQELLFYNPLYRDGTELVEAPESLVLGFSALADPTRLKLLKLIAREELPAQEMARRLELHESTVSRHLKFLVEAGLVARERQEGKFIIYRHNLDRIDTLAVTLRAYIAG